MEIQEYFYRTLLATKLPGSYHYISQSFLQCMFIDCFMYSVPIVLTFLPLCVQCRLSCSRLVGFVCQCHSPSPPPPLALCWDLECKCPMETYPSSAQCMGGCHKVLTVPAQGQASILFHLCSHNTPNVQGLNKGLMH